MTNITELVQVKASAVPSVPRQISATQRLAALELAQNTEEFLSLRKHTVGVFAAKLMDDAVELLRDLAGDAKAQP